MPPIDTQTRDSAPASQTLSRGVRVLELIAEARTPLAIDAIALTMNVHRSIAYRLVRTLEDHGLVTRDSTGLVALGARLATLSAEVSRNLQTEALPELTAIANEFGVTTFLSVLERDECVTLVSVEPQHASASTILRPGAAHSVLVGAPGKAILAALPESDWPEGVSEQLRDEVLSAREDGFATSANEVVPSLHAVAVPLSIRGERPAVIAAIRLDGDAHNPAIADRIAASVATIRESFECV